MKRELLLIAGPNGAGKTTAAFALLPSKGIKHFLNADEIARGLSPLNPALADGQATRILFKRIKEMFEKGESFALETTLSGHSHLRFIETAKAFGYHVTLIFLYLENVDIAVERVARRVEQGGHGIPIETIKRRYAAGLKNLFGIYTDHIDDIEIYNRSGMDSSLIAFKSGKNIWTGNSLFAKIQKDFNNE